jgi:hypothetical protein
MIYIIAAIVSFSVRDAGKFTTRPQLPYRAFLPVTNRAIAHIFIGVNVVYVLSSPILFAFMKINRDNYQTNAASRLSKYRQ